MADQGVATSAPRQRGTRGAFQHVFGLLAVVVALAIALAGMSPPAALPADAPKESFSATRAAAHLTELTRSPRPVASRGHAEARAYLERQLTALGLEPAVQRTAVTHKFFGRTSGAVVENVVARLKGRGSDRRALLFAAHYDSVPQSPGAGDDGAGTVTLLELARVLTAQAPLDRDVVFLFTDGEELGLLGAGAFVQEHALAKDVVAAFNFDARGSRGSVAMFDTSAGNGALLEGLARAPRVAASSLVTTLAKLMPNDTDATIFKKAGIATMSFAFAEGVANYHRATDELARLDRRSVQMMGDSALALALHFGTGDLPALEQPDVAYFTLAGRVLLRVSPATLAASAAASALVVGLATLFAVRRRDVRASLVLGGVATALVAVVLSLLAGLAVAWGTKELATFDSLLTRPLWLGLTGALAAFAVVIVVFAAVLRKIGASALTLGTHALLAVLALGLALAAPGAAPPFIAASVATLLPALFTAYGVGRPSRFRAPAFYLGTAAALLFFVPTVYAVSVAAAQSAATPAAVFAAPVWLVAAPLVAAARGRRIVTTLGVLGGGIALGFIVLALPPGDDAPRRTSLLYGVEADKKQGFYFASSVEPWMDTAFQGAATTKRALPELVQSDALWQVGPGEATGLEGVALEREERRVARDGYEIRLTVRSSKDARCVLFYDDARHIAEVLSAQEKQVRHLVRFSPEKDEVLARTMRGGPSGFWFQFCGLRGAPLDVVFFTRRAEKVPLRVLEVRDGLPLAAPKPRPEGELPEGDSDRTLVARTLFL